MNAMQIFSLPSIQALGWTLLHSLWQGLIVIAVVLVAIRCIPAKWSTARYAVATGGLLLMFVTSLITFIALNNSADEVRSEALLFGEVVYVSQPAKIEVDDVAGLLRTATAIIQYYLPFIVLCWAAGTIVFTIRLVGGWLTVTRLKATALPVEGEWKDRLRFLSRKAGINEMVTLAESAMAQAPLVIGYFKPVILIPLGMLGGLSTDQLESVIIHELIHIRRRDYLVNLLQSVLEAVFFFNPFVWIISGIIRREREHCCDDAVVALHGNPLVYAHALTVLEEARLSRSGLALSLAEDKNQLLNRIKRIMEKSVKPYSLRERFVPAILLITGLLCASWLTISSGESTRYQDRLTRSAHQPLTSDTTIKIEKSGRYYKRSITTIGDDGKPHEEVIEKFEGDEDLRPLLAPMDFDFPVPAVDAVLPDMMAAMPAIPYFKFDFTISGDTVPFHEFHNPRDWEEWARNFERTFTEKFHCNKPDLAEIEKHQEEIQQVMKDLETSFDRGGMEELADQMRLLSMDNQFHQDKEIWAQQAERMKDLGEQMGRWAEENARQFEGLNRHFNELEASRGVFEKDFRDELVKDGYLKEDEEINSIEITDESIEVNDKKIKESDLKKYRNILKENSLGPRKFKYHRSGRLE